jgi:hypothetical protein
MSFGGQAPTIIVLKEGGVTYFPSAQTVQLNEMCRHRSVAGARTDTIEHQRMSSSTGYHQEHVRSIWRRSVTGRLERQADNHE